jgi:hypothetical protein
MNPIRRLQCELHQQFRFDVARQKLKVSDDIANRGFKFKHRELLPNAA